MYRIDNSTAATTLPTPEAVGPNPNGYFTNGNPAGGVAATVVDGDWLNALQEELAGAVTASGRVLSKTNNGQLAEAIADKNPGRLVAIQRFLTSGTYTKSAGVTKICVRRAVGAGGAGAGSTAPGSGACSTCSGGATGAWVQDVWFDVTDIDTAPVTIGQGSAGGAGSGGTGGATGVSTANWSLLCPGGGGGAVKQDVTTVAFDVSAQANGGAAPTIVGALYVGNSAGGVPGLIGLLFSGSVVSGQGASCPFGAGGINTNGGNGGAAVGFGSGGGGAAVQANGSTVTGGAGANGYLEIWEYTDL